MVVILTKLAIAGSYHFSQQPKFRHNMGRTVFGLVHTLFDLQTFIANLFLMQGVTEVAQQTQTVRDTFTPTQILRSLLGGLLVGSLDPFTMGVYRRLEGALTEGHSLTPYRVEDRGRRSGLY